MPSVTAPGKIDYSLSMQSIYSIQSIVTIISGVLLAILEKLGYILPICSEDGQKIDVTPGDNPIKPFYGRN